MRRPPAASRACRVAIAVASVVVAGLPSAASADPPKRTLAELLALARTHAHQVAVAQAELAVRHAQKSEALRLWAPMGEMDYLFTGAPAIECRAPLADSLPQVQSLATSMGISASDLRVRDCTSTVDPSGANVSVLNPNISGVGMELDLKLTQPLYTFGKIESAVSAAGHGIAAGQAGVAAAQGEVDLLVARAYWGWKAARTALATLSDVRGELVPWVDKIEKDLDSQKPQFSVGDLKRMQLAVSGLDLGIADAENKEAVARGGMRALIGEETDIDDAELDPVEVTEQPPDYYQREALVRRPEVRQLGEGVAALRSVARLRLSEMLPDFAFIGAVSWRYASSPIEDSQSAYQTHANFFGFGVFLALHQPLDIAERLAKLRHAHADADLLAAQADLAKAGIGFEIDQAFAGLVEARKRVAIAEEAQRKARGWFTAEQQNVDTGTSDSRTLVEAARSYIELRLRYYQAIHDLNLASAQLRRASGVDVAR